MQLDVSAEVLLSQLGYSHSEASIKQAQKVINSTKNFNKFSKHIFSLNDQLKKMHASVMLSNSKNYLKIKCDENDSKEIISEFQETVNHWSQKYNIKIEKINNKLVYYILGVLN